MTDLVSTLGAGATAYSVAAGTTLLLQMRTMKQRGSSRDVSLAFLATTSGGYLIWLLYGLAIGSMPLVVSDAIGVVCSAAAFGVALRLRRPRTNTRPHPKKDHDLGPREAARPRLPARPPSASLRHDVRGPLRQRLLEAERSAA
jgi:MtN3 and saliva related transmembrane protein